jgi:hypothetical protein
MKLLILHPSSLLQTCIRRYNTKLLSSFLIVFIFLLSGTVSAQTNPYVTVGQSKLVCTRGNDACPANDLQVKDLFIAGIDECINCKAGEEVTRDLFMVIDNTTGSIRTSFALYGNLSTGSKINGITGKIFICVGPINVIKGLNTFKVGQITFICGQPVTLTDNYLAYTPANSTTEAACATFAQATSCKDISPKCGVAASITIRTPGTAKAETVNDPCNNGTTADGSIKITPSGGKAPYNIAVYTKGTGDCPASPSGTPVYTKTGATGAETATGLAAGTYCIYVTDANGCKVSAFTHSIGKDCCTPPGAPVVCQVPADLCGDGKVVLKVSSTIAGAVYHVKQGGTAVSGSPKTAATDGEVLTFKVTPGGGNIEVYGVTSSNGTTCQGPSTTSDCVNSPNGIGICSSTNAAVARQSKIAEQEIVLKGKGQTTITAAPNPYNDRIRFSLKSEISGRGSLELYNTMGQKVKTLFQGQVNAGQVQTIDYVVPETQRAGLIYLFRVGSEQTTGKLIGLK